MSNIVEPFRKKYQTDQPKIAFLYCDLKDIVFKLLDIIVEHRIIEKWKTVDGNLSGQRGKPSQCYQDQDGFSVEDTIKNLKQKDLVTITETNAFKEGTKWFIISMLAKLFEKRESSNINEVIRAVLNPLLFFYEKILHAPKAPKPQKRDQPKVQNATSEQK